RLLSLPSETHKPAGGAVAAIGKRREDRQQQRLRRESGVRQREREEEAVGPLPPSKHPGAASARDVPRPPPPRPGANSPRARSAGSIDRGVREDAAGIEWLLDQASEGLSR